ncbi:MAG TPA: acyl-CoA dehydrogenase [Acidimicrobiia bacterium]|nr:acyl-CoA dehydrogenase [Acidimicrobiia bacterium]
MPIGISEEHEALRQAARGWVERHCPPEVPRSFLDAGTESLPAFWGELAAQGWCGLHVDEALGGEGYGLPELVVVLEELGRAGAPGPFLPTVLAAAVIQAAGKETAADILPELASGETVGAVALEGRIEAEPDGDGRRVRGTLRAVLSGHLAGVLVARAGDDWYALTGDEFTATELASLDPTRRVAEVRVDGAVLPSVRRLDGVDTARVRDLAAVVFAAEGVGVAQWCVETASEYAKVREQFGRPIGQFQGVKHKCADMLAETELARAAVWDAARAADEPAVAPLTAAAAAGLAVDAAYSAAKDCIQVHGGIGFTWEHDAHLYLKRATTTRQLLGPTSTWRVRAAEAARGGARRRLAVDLPPEAEALRDEVRAFATDVKGLDEVEQRRRLADAGYLAPQWPKPWGRDASALEQLVIDDEFRKAKVRRPNLSVGAWALPPLMVYGTDEQQQRWIPATLRGEISWCQLFSEPGAGSDLAALMTRATRDDGGWVVNGQKVWTSMAQNADWGILIARTDPDAAKHDGISYFMLDMKTPGIDIRPLRELTGEAWFNEVFFNDVFVPDDCLVGAPNDGWRAARTTLANERVYMGSGSSIGYGVQGVLKLLDTAGLASDPIALDEAGSLVAEEHALSVLGFRLTLQALGGADPSGSEAAVRKLLGVEHDQRVQEVGLQLLGSEGTVTDGEAAMWVRGFLFNRCLTIAGGTSEVQRNVIAERLLGLPRDP